MNKIDLAYEIASKYHAGQLDKSGKDYINHPVAVAAKLKSEDEKIVALLHDTLEDTSLTKNDLEAFGFEANIVEAVVAITRLKDEDYFEFIRRVKNNPLAKKVKIADLLHNSNLNRLTVIKPEDLERQKKYLKALEILLCE